LKKGAKVPAAQVLGEPMAIGLEGFAL
jgi:hypothetical protein